MLGKDICNYTECTGCYACANVCPKRCISLKDDKFGEIHPVVDQNACIDCKLCQKTCPNNRERKYSYPNHCYAAWLDNKKEREICASGGIATIISKYILGKGGVLFGSRYDQLLNPVITWTDQLKDIEAYKGSRYVQSKVGNDTFRQVKQFLSEGKPVVYIGTPCQISGLYAFLRKPYEKLVTVDLICHGVSPTTYFKQEIDYLSKKFNLTGISDARFRGNDGNNFRLTLWNKDRRKLFPKNNYRQKIFDVCYLDDYYIQGFLKGVSLRENCYSCKYARPDRISDITIGDFIGLGKKIPFEYHTQSNISSITTNTQKGYDLLMSIKAACQQLILVERDYKERLEYKPSLVEPFKRDPRNQMFRKLYTAEGFSKAIRLVMESELHEEYHKRLKSCIQPKTFIKNNIKWILGKKGTEMLKKIKGVL